MLATLAPYLLLPKQSQTPLNRGQKFRCRPCSWTERHLSLCETKPFGWTPRVLRDLFIATLTIAVFASCQKSPRVWKKSHQKYIWRNVLRIWRSWGRKCFKKLDLQIRCTLSKFGEKFCQDSDSSGHDASPPFRICHARQWSCNARKYKPWKAAKEWNFAVTEWLRLRWLGKNISRISQNRMSHIGSNGPKKCCMFFRFCQHPLKALDKVLSFRTLNDINKNADTSELFIEKLDPG